MESKQLLISGGAITPNVTKLDASVIVNTINGKDTDAAITSDKILFQSGSSTTAQSLMYTNFTTSQQNKANIETIDGNVTAISTSITDAIIPAIQSKADKFKVVITEDQTTTPYTYTADKTAEEIHAAYTRGAAIIGVMGEVVLQLAACTATGSVFMRPIAYIDKDNPTRGDKYDILAQNATQQIYIEDDIADNSTIALSSGVCIKAAGITNAFLPVKEYTLGSGADEQTTVSQVLSLDDELDYFDTDTTGTSPDYKIRIKHGTDDIGKCLKVNNLGKVVWDGGTILWEDFLKDESYAKNFSGNTHGYLRFKRNAEVDYKHLLVLGIIYQYQTTGSKLYIHGYNLTDNTELSIGGTDGLTRTGDYIWTDGTNTWNFEKVDQLSKGVTLL